MLFSQNLSIPLFNQKVSLEGRFSVKAYACPTRAPTGGGRWMAARTHDAVHGAVHGAFMAMPLYTGIRQGEGHVLGPSVRNGSHRARSRPCQTQARALNGLVKPLQPQRHLVGSPVRHASEARLPLVAPSHCHPSSAVNRFGSPVCRRLDHRCSCLGSRAPVSGPKRLTWASFTRGRVLI